MSWTKRLIGVRKSSKVFGRGSLSFIRPANRAVLVYVRQYENDTILCVANLSRSAQAAEIDLGQWKGRVPQEMIGGARFPRIGDRPYVVTLAPYGFLWFYLCDDPEERQEVRAFPRELATLVMTDGWNSLRSGRQQYVLEREILPGFVAERRWFGDKSARLPSTRIQSAIPLDRGGTSVLLTFIGVAGESGESRYFLPLTVKWTRFDRIGAAAPNTVSAVRRGSREGTLLDAAGDQDFISLLLHYSHAGETVSYGDQRIQFHATTAFRQMPAPSIEKVTVADREQSNTTVLADANYVVKLLRRVNEGIHPEIEVGRFLVEEAGFKNAPDLLAWGELVEGDSRSAIAVVHRFIENQGDAWSVTGAYLDRFIDEQRVLSNEPPEKSLELASYLQRVRLIGRRTGELQNALASRNDIPDFAPEPISPQDVTAWTERMLERSKRTFDLLAQRRTGLSEGYRDLAGRLLEAGEAIAGHARQLLPTQIDAFKIRHHGDFHLGQVLIAKDDIYILDFEGEPQRSLADRRRKAAAARDVAGLIRSIDYSTTAALTRAHNLTAEERALLDPKLEIWREQSIEAFWNAVREVSHTGLWPSDPANAQNLLDFFLLEKVLYELEYELMNRPAWLHVPLEGMWRILSRHGVVQQ